MPHSFVALVSGGKDSMLAILEAAKYGHACLAIAHIAPPNAAAGDDKNSFMYQSVGSNLLPAISQCMNLPCVIRESNQVAGDRSLAYTDATDALPSSEDAPSSIEASSPDEIEDLYQLLLTTLEHFPSITAVCTGAIFSTYQRCRVEQICSRAGLDLVCLSYLWRQPQAHIMSLLPHYNIDARLIKVSSGGLTPRHLMKSATELLPHFNKLNALYDFHVAGEGGEYETIVLDCDLYTHGTIVVTGHTVEIDDENEDNAFVRVTDHHVDAAKSLAKSAQSQAPQVPPPVIIYSTGVITPNAPASASAPLPPPILPLPHIVTTNGGFVAIETIYPDTAQDPDATVVTQALSILATISATLSHHNLTPLDVTYTHVYLASIADFAQINAPYRHLFGTSLPPSRACVGLGAANMPPGVRVYMDVYASAGSGRQMRLKEQERGYEHNKVSHARV